jgi:hypothetical protein
MERKHLKHNFLLKRFFLHRGYYDLTHMSSDKYRQDQLNPGNIGAISLTNLPPAAVGRQSWDGICLVVLKPKH